jgi:hypothetical protein
MAGGIVLRKWGTRKALAIVMMLAGPSLICYAILHAQPPAPGGAAIATNTITVLLGGQLIGSAPILNFQPTSNAAVPSGIVMSCVSDPALMSIDCNTNVNSVRQPTIDQVHHNLNFLQSTNGTTLYTAKAPGSALTSYQLGDTWLLDVDTTCSGSCGLNIDGIGVIDITQQDGSTAPTGQLIAGQARWIWFDGTVFRLV